ncbi:MAG TPA: iron chelate uptake ABC transporter family permease subunit [Longimicrobiales bacterium]|nr:iron chelate uptake ABC transporter family permease subunit [Longimicrobiales bacterium]
MDLLFQLFQDYTLRTVALGAAALGIVSGTLGAYAVLRRQSLLGDAISHAALPGIVLAFLLTGSKSTLVLVLGAGVAGLIATLIVMTVTGVSRVPEDSALGIVLSVFFGFGLVLLTYVQKLPDARQAGLETFLFGQAATLLERDVIVIASLGAVALLAVLLFWKEFKLLSFDREFGATLGFPMRVIDVLLTTMLVLAIVIGLQTVGVVLMSAMVVAPAAAARQWTHGLGRMVVLSALFGGVAGLSGALASSSAPGVATGPAVVLAATAIVIVSLLFAPARGVAWRALERRRRRREIREDAVLLDLYALAAQHGMREHAHPADVLVAMRPGVGVEGSLDALAEHGYARRSGDRGWVLTKDGRTHARDLLDQERDRS